MNKYELLDFSNKKQLDEHNAGRCGHKTIITPNLGLNNSKLSQDNLNKDDILVDVWVKVCFVYNEEQTKKYELKSELMFIKVTEINGNNITGYLDNDPCMKDLNHKDVINLNYDNVISVYTG